MAPVSLARDIHDVARLAGRFELHSGAVSDTYFDKYRFESDPVLLRRIGEAMAPLIPAETEILGGLEMGGIPVVTILSQITALPAAFLHKERKAYGTRKYAEGPELAGRRVTLVEDVVSSGKAILNTLSDLRADDVDVLCAVCVSDRQSGGREALAERNLELRPLLTMDELTTAAG
ncbi:MAG: orotate phosphoribosyltransferase [Gammaproteobacteria bacterium]|nr:orotate phosphoribosyltransferase [Gammaproteobacteria bacterium]